MHIVQQHAFAKSLKSSEIFVRTSGFVTTDATWMQEPLYAPYTRIYFVMAGKGVLFSENERIPLEPGYVYLAPCGMKYGFYGAPSIMKLYFHVNVTLSEDAYDAFSNYGHFIRIPRAVEYMEHLKEQYLSEDPYEHFLLKNELWRTVCEGLQTVRTHTESFSRYSDATAFAIGYVYRNLSAALTVKTVAEGSFCSQSQLSALFRREVGQSIASYIDDLLMADASNRLIYTNDSVSRISEQLGFCDQFYFSRKFTKRFGLSPLQYRRKQRGAEHLESPVQK